MNAILWDASVSEFLKRGELDLRVAGVSNASRESLWIMDHALRVTKSRETVNLVNGSDVPHDAFELYNHLIVERSKRIPLAYLLGTQPFLGHEFEVTPSVLIPRPETEILVKKISVKLGKESIGRALDIGTGSGCIAVGLASACPRLTLTATDASAEALQLAKKNAILNGFEERIIFIHSLLFEGLNGAEAFDAILSNPPYIKTAELNALEAEIHFEPRLALDGGADGLEVIRPLVQQSSRFLKSGGILALEIGYDQSDSVEELMSRAGFGEIEKVKDSQQIDRVLMGTYIHG